MSGLKKFLDRRAKGLAEKTALENGEDIIPTETEYETVLNHDLGYTVKETEVPIKEASIDLTDDEFWDISNEFNKRMKNSSQNAIEVLQNILQNYSALKIEQFGKRYAELNK